LSADQDLRGETLAEEDRAPVGFAFAVLDVVGELDQPARLVVERHVNDVGREDVTELVAQPFDQRVQIELLDERLTDIVHDRELGRALPGLVEQPRVLERDAQGSRERHQEPDVTFAERMFSVEVLERDQADRAITDQERSEDGRLRDLPREHGGLSHLGAPRDEVFVDHDGLARLDRDTTVPDQLDRLFFETDPFLDHVRELHEAR
jgi:hypothetical protein